MTHMVDFDGTLCKDGRPNIPLINDLRNLQAQGHMVVLFTSRVGQRLKDAVQFCSKYGLFFNGVIGGKPVADFYIDDRAIPVRME